MRFLIKTVVIAISIWLTTLLVSGVRVEPTDGSAGETILTFLVIGLIFALVNAIVKPIVKVLTFPIYLLTFGLFALVINALMLLLTSWITTHTDFGLHVDGFWWAVGGSIVISIFSFLISAVVDRR